MKDVKDLGEQGEKLFEFRLRLDVTVHTLIKTRQSHVKLLPMARTVDTRNSQLQKRDATSNCSRY